MTKTKSRKQGILLSALALLLCVSMFIGSTFAWFTDEVTSGANEIVAGTLDVELYNALQDNLNDDTKIKEGGLFEEITRWEPGMLAYENLTIANEGNLALKYALSINFSKENTLNGCGLSDVLKVAFVPGGLADDASRDGVLTAAQESGLKDLDSFTQNGALLPAENAHITIDRTDIPVQYATYAVVIYWAPSEADNNFNVNNQQQTSDGEPLHINLGVKLFATQLAAEDDAFGSEYDKKAEYLIPAGDSVTYVDHVIDGNVENHGTLNIYGDDSKITGTVTNNGTLNITGATIDVDGRGLTTTGKATLEDATVEAGTAGTYGVAANGADAILTLEDVDLKSGGGAIGATNGATVIINSGSVDVDSKSTSGRYHIYAEGTGTTVIVNGGTFDFNKTQNQKRAYVYADAGTTVIINGGTFGKASTRSGYNAGIMGSGTVIITGGSFKFDPSKWVAVGCEVVKVGDTWTVQAMSQADANAALESAIEDGATTVALGTGTYSIPSAVAGKEITIEGVGENTVIDFTKAHNVGSASITFKNLHIQGKNANVMNGFGIHHTTGDIVYENCTFDGAVTNEYSGTVTYRNCTFTGTGYITTYAVKSATFENCVFDKADSRAVLVYSHGNNPCVVTLINCTFKAAAVGKTGAGDWTAAVEVDTTNIPTAGTTVTIENCTYDANYSGIVRDKSAAGKANAVITVDGVNP